jgi:hypothetical protein
MMSPMHMHNLVWLSLSSFLLAFGAAAQERVNPIHFLGLDRFTGFQCVTAASTVTLTSPWLTAPRPWDELVVSWNVVSPPGGNVRVEARAGREEGSTPFYVLGLWAPGPDSQARRSIPGQKDAQAEVKTDTLVCRSRMERSQVRLTLHGDATLPRVKFVSLCLLDLSATPPTQAPNRAVWGRALDVPQRSQLGHTGASGWCSPTCVSMILAYWAGQLHRRELDVSVPEVAQAVHDPNWPGTGNWPFNTAFAGQFDGVRAYVTRLGDVREVEDWVAVGVPVAASVSFDLLNGKSRDEGTGHLIVVVGFTTDGNVVANDPWPNPKKENSVRRVFPRQNFIRAWERSKRTVYLIYPVSQVRPRNRLGHWAE